MRVAYICADPGVPVFGRKGSSVHVQSVIRALIGRGAQVTLFASRVDGDPPPGLEGVELRKLPRPPKGSLAEREAGLLAANRDLTAALKQSGPIDMVYERYSLWSYAGMEFARRNRIPGLLEVNAPLIDEQANHRGLLDRTGAERVAWRAFGAATNLLAVSDEVAAYLNTFDTARGRVQVVPNGVDPTRFAGNLLPSLPASPGICTIGFVGTLKPWHGLDVLLEAFAQLHQRRSSTRLLLVGDGPMRPMLEERSAELGLQQAVEFTGAVDPLAIPGMLRSMDIATAPYPALDNCYFSPLKLFEYMAASLPTVASHIGQAKMVIQDGQNGLFCAPGNSGSLATALERLSDDTDLRLRLGDAARKTVLQSYTWDAIANRVLTLSHRAERLERVVG
ncbi:MAG: glycosyltransferase family 4 protein [Chloroflexota bacterium]